MTTSARKSASGDDYGERPYRPLAEVLPESFFEAVNDGIEAAAIGHMDWISASGGADAYITSHACNDLQLLLHQTVGGDGRSAARTARAMYEHAVGIRYLSHSPDAPRRYLDHAVVYAYRLAGVDTSSRLDKRYRTRDQKLRAKLKRQVQTAYDDALNQWTTDFRRRWSGKDLRDMAKTVGMEDDYEAYAVLSGMTHGTAGGLKGTTQRISGSVVHRLGPDLEILPTAFLLGLQWWRSIAEMKPEGNARTQILSTTDDLLGRYTTLYDQARRLDKQTWPTTALDRMRPMVFVWPSGKVKWYVWNPVEDTFRLALEPAQIPVELAQQIQDSKDQAAREVHSDQPIALEIKDIRLELDPSNTSWVPAMPWQKDTRQLRDESRGRNK
ncbi:DUF5677 domain-containing protein [Calidifontibacter indicus]|uniref:DUF5677 domain-containing protein n=1 Tax=Calidifontibacter indicus TaxID=419650 RepID=UPI003D710AC0